MERRGSGFRSFQRSSGAWGGGAVDSAVGRRAPVQRLSNEFCILRRLAPGVQKSLGPGGPRPQRVGSLTAGCQRRTRTTMADSMHHFPFSDDLAMLRCTSFPTGRCGVSYNKRRKRGVRAIFSGVKCEKSLITIPSLSSTTSCESRSANQPVGSRGRDLGFQHQAGRGLKPHAAEEGHELVVVPRHLGAHSYPIAAHVGKVAGSMPRTAVPRK